MGRAERGMRRFFVLLLALAISGSTSWIVGPLAAPSGTVLYPGRRADPYLGFSGSVQPYYDELARRKLSNRALAIMVVIDDGNGLISVYVHLAKATVRRGDVVEAGETIGFEGATGNATGCHPHYSIYPADGPGGPGAAPLLE